MPAILAFARPPTPSAGGVVLSHSAYTYDVFDRVIAREVNGVRLLTVYNGANPWADFDASGSVAARYLYGDGADEILARWRPADGQAWYLADKQGTIRDVIDSAGAVIGQRDYDGFGQILAATGAVDRFSFQGREWEAAAGLYQFRARFYDPILRQFTSEDPLGFAAGDANLRRFVFNSPLSYTDPSGQTALVEYLARLAVQTATEFTLCMLAGAAYKTLFSVGRVGVVEALAEAEAWEYGLCFFLGTELGLTALGIAGRGSVSWVANLFRGGRPPLAGPIAPVQPGLGGIGSSGGFGGPGGFSSSAAAPAKAPAGTVGRIPRFKVPGFEPPRNLPPAKGQPSPGRPVAELVPQGAPEGGATQPPRAMGGSGAPVRPTPGGGVGQGGSNLPPGAGPSTNNPINPRIEINRNADLATEMARRAAARGRLNGTPQDFGNYAHRRFDQLNSRLNRRLINEGSPYRVATEQFRDAAGRVVAPRSPGSIGADAVLTRTDNPAFVEVFDLKTHGGIQRFITASRQAQFLNRFGSYALELFRLR